MGLTWGGAVGVLAPEVVEQIQGLWTQFATQDGFGDEANWPPFSLDTPSVLALQPTPEVTPSFRGGRCDALIAQGLVPIPGSALAPQ